MIYDQIEETCQFARRGFCRIRLLWSCEKMQSFIGCGHETIEKRNIHAVEILQSIEDTELRPEVQMQGGMADGSKIEKRNAAVSLL